MSFSQFVKNITSKLGQILLILSPIIGLLILWLLSKDIILKDKEIWQEFFKSVAIALITSGVLSATLTSLKSIGYFKYQLSEILYGDEFLRHRSDLRALWVKISRELYKQKFKRIRKKLETIITEIYLPKNHNYYTSNLTIDILIRN